MVGLVVSHGEWGRFWKTARREFRSEVVGRAATGGALVGDRDLVAVPRASLPPGAVRVQLLHNYLVSALGDRGCKSRKSIPCSAVISFRRLFLLNVRNANKQTREINCEIKPPKKHSRSMPPMADA